VPAGLTNVTAIAGGANHSLALQSDGTVVAWGGGPGGPPVPAGLRNVTAIAAGSYHSLALSTTQLTNGFSPLTVAEDAGAQTVSGFASSLSDNDGGTQTLTFTVTNNNDALFRVPPALAANGTLTFTPATNATGTATVTVIAQDNGGTNNSGVDTSAPQTFLLTVTPVNDAPVVILPIADFAVNEDAANVVTNLTLHFSDVETSAVSLTYAVVGNTNASLVMATITQGTNLALAFAANRNGTSQLSVSATDPGGLSVTNSFVVTVNAVNDVPSFALRAANTQSLINNGSFETGDFTGWIVSDTVNTSPNLAVRTNGASLGFFSASASEGTKSATHGFSGTVAGTIAISQDVIVPAGGAAALSFTYRLAWSTIGSSASAGRTFRMTVQPAGGGAELFTQTIFSAAPNTAGFQTANTPVTVDFSASAGQSIRIGFITDIPTGDAGNGSFQLDNVRLTATTPDFMVYENSGMSSLANLATNMVTGPANESGETVTFIVSNNNNGLFSSQPAVAANGTVTFTPAANSNGVAMISVASRDSGGTANSGVDTSAVQTFKITVLAVNSAPTVTLATNNVVVLEDSGTYSGALASFSGVPADESGQSVTNVVTSNSSPGLFNVQPSVSTGGLLTFTPAANANGVATVTMVVQDNGGTANGGVDKSSNTFTITVLAVTDAPAITLATNNVVRLEDSGAHSVSGFATFTAGPANESGQSVTNVTTSNDNAALFSVPPSVALNGTLTFTPAANTFGAATVTVIAQDNGGIADGGSDKSTKTFTITVLAVNDAPTFVLRPINTVADLIINGSFETGDFTGWIASDTANASPVQAVRANGFNLGFFNTLATDGAKSAAHGFSGANAGSISIAQDLTLPTAGSAALTFAYRAGWNTFGSTATSNRTFRVSVRAAGGGAELFSTNLVSVAPNDFSLQVANTPVTLDLTAFAGQSIRLAFVTVIPFGDAGNGSFQLDDVRVVATTPDLTVFENSGTTSIANLTTNIVTGPVDEVGQTVTFLVGNNHSGLFSSQPSIAANGTLTFTPAPNSNGVASVTVIAQDSGGSVNGGVDKATNTFSIMVRPAASVTRLAVPANGAYPAGSVLSFTVTFSAVVNVTGTPQLRLNLGPATVNASYSSGSGSTNLVFTYTVQVGDTATDGLVISSPVFLNGGTIREANNADARLTFAPPITALAPPANDAFAGRVVIVGESATVNGFNVAATREAGEPEHAGLPSDATVWWTWTAPRNGVVTINTVGTAFDTILAVYRGTAVGALTLLAANDDAQGTASSVSFPVTGGTSYQIAVGGLADANGDVTLNLLLPALPVAPAITSQPVSRVVLDNAGSNVTFSVTATGAPVPTFAWQKNGLNLLGVTNSSFTITNALLADAGGYRVVVTNASGSVTSSVAVLTVLTASANDAFADRFPIVGASNNLVAQNYNATREAGEPVHAAKDTGASLWWTWVAPRNGLVQVDTMGSTNAAGDVLNTVLAVYTGNTLNTLTPVSTNDDEIPSQLSSSKVFFRAAAGVSYQIAVAGFRDANSTVAVGSILLNLAQAPDNDYFTNRLAFPLGVARVRDNNVGTTKEPGERTHAFNAGGKSVWWSWVAPSNGLYRLDTTGSSFDTLLAVYTGSALNALTLVGEHDGDPADNFFVSRVQFQAVGGTEYQFAVDGYQGASGDVVLNLGPVVAGGGGIAANNNFAQRIAFLGQTNRVTASTVGATKEASEPNHGGNAGGHSVWWSWIAPITGPVTLSTTDSSFDTTLAAYTGTGLDVLTLVAGNDDLDAAFGVYQSTVTFPAVAGLAYQIAVDGHGSAAGAVVLTLTQPTPEVVGGNDLFANRFLISGQTNTVVGANTNATKEAGEPNHGGNRGGRSIWWRWVAPAATPVTIDTAGSSFSTLLAVYTGTEVNALTMLAADHLGSASGSTVTFLPIAGVEYQIAVDGFHDGITTARGAVTLNVRQYPSGSLIGNDDFENATPISPQFLVVFGANIGATRQENEPAHAGLRQGASAWWAWTALNDGAVTITTEGSEFDTVLGVYTGSSLASLALVAENDDPRPGTSRASVSFQATLGTVYRIAVDGYRNAMGLVKLTVISGSTSPAAPSIKQQPASQTRFTGGAGGGTAVEFRVVATGALPLAFEWQRNSVIIEGATGPVLALTGVSAVNEGEYRVVVRNSFGMVSTLPATFTLLPGTFNDHFANRISLAGSSSTVSGSVLGATKEPDEPAHGGNDGGRSVWWKWTAPANGLVEIDTFGSSFDTTLAIYTGSALSGLSLVAENDDVPNGKVGISRVLFSATVGTEYQIAVDGFKTNSTTGNVVLNLRQPPAPPTPLQILTQPVSQTVIVGANVSLSVSASGKGVLSYQWRKDSADLLNATDATLTLNPVQLAQGGSYTVRVSDAFTDLLSQPALLVVATSRIAPPTPQNATAIQAQGFTLNLQLEVGRAFRVQASDTLIGGWTDIRSFVSDGSALEFLDVAAKTKSQRFYRVVSP